MLDGEGTEQMDSNNPNFLASCVQSVDGRLYRLGTGAHQNDHPFGIGGTCVVKQVIVATSDRCKAIHRFLDNLWTSEVETVDTLTCLEIHIGIL